MSSGSKQPAIYQHFALEVNNLQYISNISPHFCARTKNCNISRPCCRGNILIFVQVQKPQIDLHLAMEVHTPTLYSHLTLEVQTPLLFIQLDVKVVTHNHSNIPTTSYTHIEPHYNITTLCCINTDTHYSLSTPSCECRNTLLWIYRHLPYFHTLLLNLRHN